MKNKINIYIKKAILAGFFTSLCAPAIIVSIAIIFSYPINFIFLVIIYLISIIIYLFDYVIDKKKNFYYYLFLFFCLLLVLISIAIYANILSLYYLMGLLFIGILYPLVFKKLTKLIVGFKDFYVAITWNLIIPFYLLYFSIPFSRGLLLFMLFVLIRNFVNISFCDIKDISEDKFSGLKTLASYLGKNKLIKILHILNFSSIFLLLLGVFFLNISQISLLLIIPSLLSSIMIFVGDKYKFYSSSLVDFEYLLWAVALLSWKYL